jgi:hypothetical protein
MRDFLGAGKNLPVLIYYLSIASVKTSGYI